MSDTLLLDLGFVAFFADQIDAVQLSATPPARVCDVHRSIVAAKGAVGDVDLAMPPDMKSRDLAVGDWVLYDPDLMQVISVMERQSVIKRPSSGDASRNQLIAANVDTLLIVTSCNADFNESRLERYLALAISSEMHPVFVLTKSDMSDEIEQYRKRAKALSSTAQTVILNALDLKSLDQLQAFVMMGQTAALIGSSGVGKSTILSGLTGVEALTAEIREDDAKGRHTTTARCLRRTLSGGWLIDTPGIRSLGMSENADGIDEVFADLRELAATCKFSDCKHQSEPKCALRAAIKSGDLDEGRMLRWKKLEQEDALNSETIAQSRARQRGFSKMVNTTVKSKHKWRL